MTITPVPDPHVINLELPGLPWPVYFRIRRIRPEEYVFELMPIPDMYDNQGNLMPAIQASLRVSEHVLREITIELNNYFARLNPERSRGKNF